MTTFIVIAILIALLAPLLYTCVIITDQSNVRIVETFGRFSFIAESGLSFKLPAPIQVAKPNFSLKVMELRETISVKSADNAFLSVTISVQYRVNPDKANDAYYKLAKPDEQIRSYVVNQVRALASSSSFDALFRSRNVLEQGVKQVLDKRIGGFGFVIENVLVDDPLPSDELRKAFDRVLASNRLREAAENEGEAEKIRAEKKAQAEKIALELRGQALVAFRRTIAEGNADAINAFVKETQLSPESALHFITSINEVESLSTAASAGAKVVFITAAAGRADDTAKAQALLERT